MTMLEVVKKKKKVAGYNPKCGRAFSVIMPCVQEIHSQGWSCLRHLDTAMCEEVCMAANLKFCFHVGLFVFSSRAELKGKKKTLTPSEQR